jgi:hypothetical protein
MVYHAHCIDLLVGDMNYLVQRVLSAREHVDLLEGWANRSAPHLSLLPCLCVFVPKRDKPFRLLNPLFLNTFPSLSLQ